MAAVIPSPQQQVAILEEKVAVAERLHGPESLKLFGEMYILAMFHFQRGNFRAALPLIERLVKSSTVHPEFGPDHPDTLHASALLMRALACIGRHADAEAVGRRVLDVNRRVYGENHPHTKCAILDLIPSIALQGRATEARQMIAKGLAGMQHELAKPAFDQAVRQLADLLEYEGKLEDSKVRFPVIVGIPRYLKTNSFLFSHHYRQY